MQPLPKAIGLVSLFILIIGILYVDGLFSKYREYQNQARKVAHVVIFIEEEIDQLRSIEFQICDSIHWYDLTQLKDTINKNMAHSDEKFPCPVEFTYQFVDGTEKVIVTDSFDSAGCSGANEYLLRQEAVKYVYHP